jgi:hypothetical protein
MSCLNDDTIQAYLDGELSAAERAATELHLVACDACRARYHRRQETLTALWTDISKLDPPTVEIPDWSSVLETRKQQVSNHKTSGHRSVDTHITWLQGLIGLAAAATIWFVISPVHHDTPPSPDVIDSLLAQLPPVGEDPQRMWSEQCMVFTVVDKTDGSVNRYIASTTNDRIIHESIKPGHNPIEDSSKLRKGI